MMCDFKPGDKVVCVDDRLVIDKQFLAVTPLVLGSVYTVVSTGFRHAINAEVVFLKEVENHHFGKDLGYRASRFRKVQRKTTDLSIESFLTIRPGFEEPRKVTAPVREKA